MLETLKVVQEEGVDVGDTPEATPEVTPEVTPEATPEATPEETSEGDAPDPLRVGG